MLRLSSRGVLGAMVLMAALSVGCKKNAPLPPRVAAPPPTDVGGRNPNEGATGRPAIVAFTVEPSTVERGQSATLKWSVTNATSVIIDHGIGSVDVSGQRTVVPADSTTYALTARNENGSAAATATVNVTVPPEAPPARGPGPKETITQQIEHLQDAYFDYDKNDIRGDAQTALTADASALKQIFADFPSASIIVEGHCDERGSAEYNLGLGDRRASSARDFLVQLGVPADKLKTVSYGKERPKCTDATEDCYQQNRRAHFSAGQ
jgi:peptidoglycan-associated lipoprotein